MKKLNWKIIESNIKETRDELEKLEAQITKTKKPTEIELELSLRHAFFI
jgi:dynactin complex subunit